MEEIGKTLPGIIKRQLQREDSRLVEVLASLWPQIAGRAVAENSRPAAFNAGTLRLDAKTETWAAQLCALEREILEAVNVFLGGPVIKVLRVNRACGPAAPEAPKPSANPRPAQHAGVRISPCEFSAALDADTRDILDRSFSKYFAARGGRRPD